MPTAESAGEPEGEDPLEAEVKVVAGEVMMRAPVRNSGTMNLSPHPVFKKRYNIQAMADNEHFELLMRDVDDWNRWRADNPKVKPDLAYAVMRGANLALANLAEGQLHEADLVLANLRGADLRHADLSGANLVGARLLGVDLAHANICGADLSTAEDLTDEQLRETEGDTFTKLPEEMQLPQNWVAKNAKRKAASKSR